MNEYKYSIFAKSQISYAMNELANQEKKFLENDDNFILFRKIKNEFCNARGVKVYEIINENKDFFNFLISREYISPHIKNIINHIYEYDITKNGDMTPSVISKIQPPPIKKPVEVPPIEKPVEASARKPKPNTSITSTTKKSTSIESIISTIIEKPKKEKVKKPSKQTKTNEKIKKSREFFKDRIQEMMINILDRNFKPNNEELESINKLISDKNVFEEITTTYKLRHLKILNELKNRLLNELEENKKLPERKITNIRNDAIKEFINIFENQYARILSEELSTKPIKTDNSTITIEKTKQEQQTPKEKPPVISKNTKSLFKDSEIGFHLQRIKTNEQFVTQTTNSLENLIDMPTLKSKNNSKELHKLLMAIDGAKAKIKSEYNIVNKYIAKKMSALINEDKEKSISNETLLIGLSSIYNSKNINKKLNEEFCRFIQENKPSGDTLCFLYGLYQYTYEPVEHLFINDNFSKFPNSIKNDYLQKVLYNIQYKSIDDIKQKDLNALKNIINDSYIAKKLQKDSIEKEVFKNTIKQLIDEIFTTTAYDKEKAKDILSLTSFYIDLKEEISIKEKDMSENTKNEKSTPVKEEEDIFL